MWTRLVAGVAAHDINNAAQGLSNLLSLAARPGTSPEALARYGALARDGLADLRRLAATLGCIAESHRAEQVTRLDRACADAVMESEVAGRTIDADVAAMPGDLFVRGGAGSVRTAVTLVLRHCLAASPPGARVAIALARAASTATVVLDAPDALGPRLPAARALRGLVETPERELGSDGGLIFAGALARENGGDITVSATAGGVRFELSFELVSELVPTDAEPSPTG